MNIEETGTLPYKYIVFDIDGTLIPVVKDTASSEDFDYIVSTMDMNQVEAFKVLVDICHANGVKLIIATGRPLGFAMKVNDLLFAGRTHAVVCTQGWQTAMNGEVYTDPLGDSAWISRVTQVTQRMKDMKHESDFVYDNGFSCGIVSNDRERLLDHKRALMPLAGNGLTLEIMAKTIYATNPEITKLKALLNVLGDSKYAFIGDSMNDYTAMIHGQCLRIGFPANVDETLKAKICHRHFNDDRGQYFPSDRRWFSRHEHEDLTGTTELLQRFLRQDLGIAF